MTSRVCPLPRLTEEDIREWVGPTSFQRGLQYYRQGNIAHPRRRGSTLRALCWGSRPEPYSVEVTLGPGGIDSAFCSCPVGGDGGCKHVAALLLTWLKEPEAFSASDALEAALKDLPKEDLVDLVLKMLDVHPELEMLVHTATLGSRGAPPPDPKVLRERVRGLVRWAGTDWRAPRRIAEGLEDLARIGEQLAQDGNWHAAAEVYETLVGEILEHFSEIGQEEGEISAVANLCLEGLGECLGAEQDPERRLHLLQVLFYAYRWNNEHGGMGIGDEEVPDIVLEKATSEERRLVFQWVKEAMPRGGSWGEAVRRQFYGPFLLELGREFLDEEDYLRLCREAEQWHELVIYLLRRNRVEEAMEAVRQMKDPAPLHLLDLFVAEGHDGPAYTLAKERLAAWGPSSPLGTQLIAWLKDFAKSHGRSEEALEMAETLFWSGHSFLQSSLSLYREIKGLAESLGVWGQKKEELLARLAREGRYALLTSIYLEEGQVDQALEALAALKSRERGFGFTLTPLHLQVAEAAEKPRPREAIRLYLEEVERLIASRGRASYAEAAQYLRRVRNLYKRLGEEETWQALIKDIRERNVRLRALQDELNQAGL